MYAGEYFTTTKYSATSVQQSHGNVLCVADYNGVNHRGEGWTLFDTYHADPHSPQTEPLKY